ncbi:cysteine hydrolase family protein [Novosphingobium sp. JCM 18896]|uniref:cysteine hydrolase family protein n=1 Tax=Novosphingobium sp. JCM 18896 TaxID=2989731 RepID=UPI00222349C8|nr:isochorismatase family cysteine hydrolase [Novosphingobium sp. JCM 18896]MCW1432203.1 cysteine hydrolase [Novosphingobium sp. JCM 18896]
MQTRTGDQDKAPLAPARDHDCGRSALLIIDMINCFDFPGAEKVQAKAIFVAEAILGIRAAFERRGQPVIYVNDNFGEWHSERSRLVERALSHPNPVVEKLQPRDEDYFVLKPQFSGFYATNLPVLLPKLGVDRLVLTGIATDICVLFTAADAHMRDYPLWVPRNAVAAETAKHDQWALSIMEKSMAAQTASTQDLDVETWLDKAWT